MSTRIAVAAKGLLSVHLETLGMVGVGLAAGLMPELRRGALALLVAMLLVRSRGGGGCGWKAPAGVWTAALLGWLAIEVLADGWTPSLEWTLIALAVGLAVARGLAESPSLSSLQRWSLGGVGAGAVVSLATPWIGDWTEGGRVLLDSPVYDRLPAILPDTVHSNLLAAVILVLVTPAVAWRVFGGLQGTCRWGLDAACIFGAAGIVFTQSRGATLAMVAVAWGALALKWPRAAGALGAAGIGALAAGGAVYGEAWLHIYGVQGRLGGWASTLEIIRRNPWTGVEMGGLQAYVPDPAWWVHAHNLYLQVAADLGLPGLAIVAGLGGSLGWMAWRAFAEAGRRGDARLRALGAAGLLVGVAVLVQGLIDNVFWGMETAIVPATAAGIVAATWPFCERQGRAPQAAPGRRDHPRRPRQHPSKAR